MTPPPEPRTLECGYFVQCVEEAGHAVQHHLTEFGGVPKWVVPTIEPIEAEAAGAPLREALKQLPRRVAERVESQNRNPPAWWRVMAALKDEVAAALAATPAPYDGHYSVTGKLSHSTTTTPAPEPFYDSDGIPLPDELFAGLEPASPERSDPVLLWHGDGDECTGIHCGNPEHGWTEPAPAYVECPSCDDASAAHIAGLHEEPAPDKAASLTAQSNGD